MAGAVASQVRQRVFLLSLVVGAAVAVLTVVEGPPGSGYGWGAVAFNVVASAGVVVAIGLMVRAARPALHWWTVSLAILLAALTVLATFGNWGYESAASQARDASGAALTLVFCVVAVVVELRDRRHAAT